MLEIILKKYSIAFLVLFVFVFINTSFFAQNINQKIVDQKSKKVILYGECDRTAFNDSLYSWWYNSEYENYDVNTELLDKDKSDFENVNIIVVMATWCSDSRREVPRLIKIFNHLEIDENNIKIYNVDRKRKCDVKKINDLDAQFVPTIYFYKDGKLLGQIVETPIESLEQDILKIVTP